MTSPTVSYIVTVFNKRAYLPHVIAGLKAQTGDFTSEFIFVDDGSTDDSAAIIDTAFAGDPRLRLLRQVNQGPTAATNAGIAAATGEWIKPVDGDDVLAPWATATLLAAAQETCCEVSFASTQRVGLYTPDTPVAKVIASFEPVEPSYRQIDLLVRSLRNAQTNPSAWLAKRTIVEAVGGCDPDFFIQDYSIELRLAAAGPAAEADIEPFKAPADPTGRASANEAQILHDMNGALLNFLMQHAGQLPSDLTRFGLRRATGRAWLWARRHGTSPLSAEFAYVVRARLGLLQPSAALTERLGSTFRQTGKIRRPSRLNR